MVGVSRIGSSASCVRRSPVASSRARSSAGSAGRRDQLQTAKRVASGWDCIPKWTGGDPFRQACRPVLPGLGCDQRWVRDQFFFREHARLPIRSGHFAGRFVFSTGAWRTATEAVAIPRTGSPASNHPRGVNRTPIERTTSG